MVWVVGLVCGASGVGKSQVARGLAVRRGVPLGEVDDVVTAVRALTTAEQLPAVHAWGTREFGGPAEIVAAHFGMCDALAPGLRAVIADHVEFGAAVVLEGDYLTPELAVGFGAAVRAVVVSEDPAQVVANFAAREPAGGEQRERAAVGGLVQEELVRRARRCGVPVVPARPWHDGLDRAEAALRDGSVPAEQ